MYYGNRHLSACSKKLQSLLWEQDRIIRVNNGFSLQGPILAKIIRLAKEENQGFVYISATLDMLFHQQQYEEPYLTLPYAALFLREAQAIFEDALQTEAYPDTLRRNYLLCFRSVCSLYRDFPEISTKKMEKLFSVFQKNVNLYDDEKIFYEAKLRWEIMCRDTKAVKTTCKRYRELPHVVRCYVCANAEVCRALILLGDIHSALALSADFISGNIPLEVRDGYEDCQFANAYKQYRILLSACLRSGKIEFLDQIIPLMYQAILAEEDSNKGGHYEAITFALYGDFTRVEMHVKKAVSDWDAAKLETPYDYMYKCLIWMTYFNLLSRSDVTRVPFPTETPLSLTANEDDKYSIMDIAELFEQRADDIGAKFDKSRVNFDYAKRKESFHALVYCTVDIQPNNTGKLCRSVV